jgi:hypothetical protein
MANKYVEAIATTLQEYNKIDDPDNSIPYQVYEDLAWGNLIENNVKAWTDLSPEKKTAIANLADTAIRLTKTVPCTD